MKVKELCAKLKGVDPSADVVIRIREVPEDGGEPDDDETLCDLEEATLITDFAEEVGDCFVLDGFLDFDDSEDDDEDEDEETDDEPA